jgi:hypothetical protein
MALGIRGVRGGKKESEKRGRVRDCPRLLRWTFQAGGPVNFSTLILTLAMVSLQRRVRNTSDR